MQFNFFTWLRAGVRQAVLLGVSDAVEHLGMPEEEEVSQQLGGLLRYNDSGKTSRRASSSKQRRRLGRSLQDIEAPEADAKKPATANS